MESQTNSYDVLDLRRVVQSLVSHAGWILAAAAIAVVTALLVSVFLLPKQYQSEAIIMITPINIGDSLDPGAIVLLDLPGIQDLATLAQSQDILEAAQLNLPEKEQIDLTVNASSSQLSFQTIAPDSERSADLANRWAQAFLTYLSEQYGAESVYAQIEQSLPEKLPDYEAFESDGTDNVLGRQRDVLAARLEGAQQALQRDLAAIERCQALREEISSFHQQEQTDGAWTLEQKIVLDSLYQRAAVLLSDGQGAYLFQIFSQQGDSVAQTVEMLTTLDQLLEEKQSALEAGLENRQAVIVYLGTRLEASTNGQVAQLAIRATPPAQPLGLSPWINASLAGFLALMLAGLVVVFLEWWRVPAQDGDK